MLKDQEIKGLQKPLKKSAKRPRHDGANRRATGLLPEPSGEHGHEMPIDQYSNYRQLFADIKANKQTCCIKFNSETQKSRGAILIFQGRILGVLYGRKDLSRKLFHEEAYSHALRDLLDPETELVGHVLSEPLAIATASLFIGQLGISDKQTVGQNAFSESYTSLIDSRMPGCILVHDNENLAVLAAYIFGGKMIALYSGTEGWLPATTQVASQQMSYRGKVKVTSVLLEVENIKEVTDLTFTLSGVDNQREQFRAGLRKQSEQTSSLQKKVAQESTKRYTTTYALSRKRSKWLGIEQGLLARQHFAQLVLG
jgi:hypothetical protein